jgi:hypothetical protein
MACSTSAVPASSLSVSTRPCALAFSNPWAVPSAVLLSRVVRIPPMASAKPIPGPIIPVPTTLAVANLVCVIAVILAASALRDRDAINPGEC